MRRDCSKTRYYVAEETMGRRIVTMMQRLVSGMVLKLVDWLDILHLWFAILRHYCAMLVSSFKRSNNDIGWQISTRIKALISGRNAIGELIIVCETVLWTRLQMFCTQCPSSHSSWLGLVGMLPIGLLRSPMQVPDLNSKAQINRK